MYQDTISHFAKLGSQKALLLAQRPAAFIVGALLAGGYIGLGIVLIFSVGASIDPAWQKLVMGASFGIALTLVVFAGAELVTGHTLYMTLGKLQGLTGWRDLARVWTASWSFNFVGAGLFAAIFCMGGGGKSIAGSSDLLFNIADYKMNSSALSLVARACLCNWLVCLALWMSARTTNDAAKVLVIFWCLFAFIASGFEHSVANMTLLSIALMLEHPPSIHLYGMAHNLVWVTVGNIIGGSVFVGIGYWVASHGLTGRHYEIDRV